LSVQVTHSIELTPDGKRLFASSADKVFSWDYDAKNTKTVGSYSTWVTGMWNTDHVSRTLLLSKKFPGKLLVARGSAANIDYLAKRQSSGHCQIRVFDINKSPQSLPFATGGDMLAWGLRNSIGVAEHPADGGIWSNENGSDDLSRDGIDIHENSPGEEVNFHGYLNTTTHPNYGKNYGYPDCAASWHVSEMPRNKALKVGKQFYLSAPSGTMNDAVCETQYVAPRLTLPSHWAPIDFKFNSQGSVAYMTSRGSWYVALDGISQY
jgi:glucose/arabinose dehydrogenase